MRSNVTRRIMAFLFDFFIIIFVVTLLFRVIGEDLIKAQFDDYDQFIVTFQENLDEYNLSEEALVIELEDGIITQAQFDETKAQRNDDFLNNNEFYINAQAIFLFNSALFYIIGYMILDYTQSLVTKGKTLGRRSMKIQLTGRITWWTLLLREVMFKSLFWIVTLGVGIVIDFALIAFTSKKKTMRDYLSETYVVYSDASYPF